MKTMFDSFFTSRAEEEEEEEDMDDDDDDNASLLYLPDGTRNRVTNPLVNMVRSGGGGETSRGAMVRHGPTACPPNANNNGAHRDLLATMMGESASSQRAFAGPEAYRALETSAGRRAPPTPSVDEAYRAANRQALTADIASALDVVVVRPNTSSLSSSDQTPPPPPLEELGGDERRRMQMMTTTEDEKEEKKDANEMRHYSSSSSSSSTTTSAVAVAVAVAAPLPPLEATTDLSSKTPVMQRFATAVRAAAGDGSTQPFGP